jgi:hypothetical protein
MVKYFLILLMAFSPAVSVLAHPYPITPRPLRLLVEESQYIITGYVAKVFEPRQAKDDIWGGSVAKIAIQERLQGNIKAETIEIVFSPNMICPEPANYEEGTYVIAFVDKDKKGQYYTHALSYGAKTLSPANMEIYKERIREIQQIGKITNSHERLVATTEWLVKCAENPATRWEGTYELSPLSDFMSFYDKRKAKKSNDALTAAQKDRLKKALLATTDISYADFALADIVYPGNACVVDAFLLEGLKALKENTWLANDFMMRLAHLSPTPAMEKLILRYEKVRFEYEKEAAIKNCIADFIKLVEKAVLSAPDKAIAISR